MPLEAATHRTHAADRAQPRSEAEAHAIVEHVFGVAGNDARRRIWQHPFSQQLRLGALSRRRLVGFLYNWCVVAREVNCASAEYLHRFGDLGGRLPALIGYFASKLIEEWTEPRPGGHDAVLGELVQRLGGPDPSRRTCRLIPEMRGLVDALVWLMSTEPIDSSPILIEEWFGDWAELWIRDLARRGIATNEHDYWPLHRLADGGSSTRRGHRAGNRDVARWLLQAGLGPAQPQHIWVRNTRTSTSLFLQALDGCLARFDASDRLDDLDFVAAPTRPTPLRADPAIRALSTGTVPAYALGPFLLNWHFFHQRLACSFARLPHRFPDAHRSRGARAREFCTRFADEFTAGARPRVLLDAVRALGTPAALIRDPWILPETFMLTGFVVRRQSEGTLAEIDALPLGPLFAEVAAATSRSLAHLGQRDLARELARQFVPPGGVLGHAEAPPESVAIRSADAETYVVDVAHALVRNWLRGCLAHFGGLDLKGETEC